MEQQTSRSDGQGTPDPRRHVSRRALLRGTLGLAGVALLAACGGTPTASPAPAAQASTMPSAATGGGTTSPGSAARSSASPAGASAAATGGATPTAGFYPSPAAGVPDAYDVPPSPFRSFEGVPGRGGKVTALLTNTQAPPPPRDQNRYWQELEKRLGVTWEPTLVAGGSYDEKFATTVASGELPDYTALYNSPDQLRAISQGAFADLTPHLTGDALKAYPNLAKIPLRRSGRT